MANRRRNRVLPTSAIQSGGSNGRAAPPPRPSQQKARPSRPPRQRRPERRRRLPLAIVGVVVLVVVGLVVGKIATSSSPHKTQATGYHPALAAQAVVNDVINVPIQTIAGEAAATPLSDPPTNLSPPGPTLTSGGKPEILYMGAEYCPYCATERWAMVMALSKFGTFTNLGAIHSSSTDVYPNTQSFTFYGSTYTSPYITFVPVEQTTEVETQTLQTPTTEQQNLAKKYASGDIPFVYFDGKGVINGDSELALTQDLQGLSMQQIAQQITDPSTQIAHYVDSIAGQIIYQICKATGDKGPPGVCSAVASLG